jgi:hypothetical protein
MDEADWTALTDDVWAAASEAVWALTGRQFGVCTDTVTFDLTAEGTCLPTPLLWRGRWFNIYAYPGWPCCELRLDLGPVVSVDAVTIDGVPYDAWVLDGNRLLSQDGCWPVTIPCEARRLHVTYTHGLDPSVLVLQGVAELAGEMVQPCMGGVCRLPSNVTSVTRQGITVTLGDPTALIDAGLTGLPMLDLAIRTYNPARLPQRSRVFSPDIPRTQLV